MSVNVVVLEDDEDLQAVMKYLLTTVAGIEVRCFGSVAQLTTHADEVLDARLVFLDVNLGEGKPSGIDAHNWLKQRSFGGESVFLTGHARHHPLVAQATRLGARFLEKPVDADELIAIVKGAVAAAPAP
jgi:FixJ family two-component response regulator